MSDDRTQRKYRAGVYFDCPVCSRLWRDDVEHADVMNSRCESCGGDLALVGEGTKLVQGARWYRCRSCDSLYMRRRGEVVPATPRSGFGEFT